MSDSFTAHARAQLRARVCGALASLAFAWSCASSPADSSSRDRSEHDLAGAGAESENRSNVGSGGEAASNAQAASNPQEAACPAERSALLDDLAKYAAPCADDADCSLYIAWSLPHDSQLCDGGWPIARRETHAGELDAATQAVADCMNAAAVEDVGTCGVSYGAPPLCTQGTCVLNPRNF